MAILSSYKLQVLCIFEYLPISIYFLGDNFAGRGSVGTSSGGRSNNRGVGGGRGGGTKRPDSIYGAPRFSREALYNVIDDDVDNNVDNDANNDNQVSFFELIQKVDNDGTNRS